MRKHVITGKPHTALSFHVTVLVSAGVHIPNSWFRHQSWFPHQLTECSIGHEQYYPCETAVKQHYLKHVTSWTLRKWLHWWLSGTFLLQFYTELAVFGSLLTKWFIQTIASKSAHKNAWLKLHIQCAARPKINWWKPDFQVQIIALLILFSCYIQMVGQRSKSKWIQFAFLE